MIRTRARTTKGTRLTKTGKANRKPSSKKNKRRQPSGDADWMPAEIIDLPHGGQRRAKSGPKPQGDWYIVLGAWLIDVACDNPKRLRNVDALVIEALSFLEEKIHWTPKQPKELRQKIVDFLQFVPR